MTTKTSPDRITLRFGQQIAWDLDTSASIASIIEPDISPIKDLDSEVESALSNPLAFPSMDQAVVADDSVVFAVDPAVPALPQVLSSVLAFYHDRGTPLGKMQIVLAGRVPQQAEQLSTALAARLGDVVPILIHDADDSDSIAYVAADDASEPIYVNRLVVDADVVVPVMCGRTPGSLDDFGAFSLFPLLTNRMTFGKFYALKSLENPETHGSLNAMADQAAWWTGFMTTVQVIPAGDDQVGAVIAGATASVHEACQAKMSAAWGVPQVDSELTVALLPGGDAHQNWLGIARMLHAGIRSTREAGTLVLCTDADLSIGAALHKLMDSNLAGSTSPGRRSKASDSDDAIVASLIEQATQDRHVYLVSKIPSDTVESLGMVPIHEPTELTRLVERSKSCVILGSAQFRSVVGSP